MPVLIAAEPRIYTAAWFLMSFGLAVWVVPLFGGFRSALRMWLAWSFPFMLGLVFVLAVFVLGGDWLRGAESQAARCHRTIRPTSS